MDIQSVLLFLREFLVLIIVFSALLTYAIMRGKHALLALILGLYVALLLSLKFPYYEELFEATVRGGSGGAIVTIALFAFFTGASAFLFERILTQKYRETSFEGIGKKALLAVLGTILIMAYSYHVLPVTQLIDPGVSLTTLFAPPKYFFWLLIAPLLGFFFI